MTGWTFVAMLLTFLVSFVGGVGFGAQWVRDDIAARRRQRPDGWLPLYCQAARRKQDVA